MFTSASAASGVGPGGWVRGRVGLEPCWCVVSHEVRTFASRHDHSLREVGSQTTGASADEQAATQGREFLKPNPKRWVLLHGKLDPGLLVVGEGTVEQSVQQ